jgi:glycerol-3-phosphate acyltransferase PlsY
LIYLLAYLLGTFPTGRIIGWIYRVDITSVGSKNIGATNVARCLGKLPGALTLIIDLLKGLLGVYLADDLGGFLAVLGHTFPPWSKGGKGVATALGVLLGTNTVLFIVSLLAFSLCYYRSRIVSLSSLAAVGITMFVSLVVLSFPYYILAIGALITIRHKENIVRLINGEEKCFSIEPR